jgi:hypothetical protein
MVYSLGQWLLQSGDIHGALVLLLHLFLKQTGEKEVPTQYILCIGKAKKKTEMKPPPGSHVYE